MIQGVDVALLNLIVHLACTFYLVGLVWFVQRVHYPLFAGVGPERFASYESAHLSRTGPVVAPFMLLEAAGALALLALPPQGVPPRVAWLGAALVAAVWLSTWLLQVPRHRELASRFEPATHRRLVATNWLRTAAWSLRGVLVLWMAAAASAGDATPH